MKTTDFKDLEDTIERLRKQRYPDLDADFIQAVLKAEQESPEDDSGAIGAIEGALKKALKKKGAV